jgi:hypothetical protein
MACSPERVSCPRELCFTEDPRRSSYLSVCGAKILPPRSGSTFPARDLLGGDVSTRSRDGDLDDDTVAGRPEVRRAGWLLFVVACLRLAIAPRVRGGDA